MAPWSQGSYARPFTEPHGAHTARHVYRIIAQTGAVCVENFGGMARDRSGLEGHQPVSPHVPMRLYWCLCTTPLGFFEAIVSN